MKTLIVTLLFHKNISKDLINAAFSLATTFSIEARYRQYGIPHPFSPGQSSKKNQILTYFRCKICVKEQSKVFSKIQDLLNLNWVSTYENCCA